MERRLLVAPFSPPHYSRSKWHNDQLKSLYTSTFQIRLMILLKKRVHKASHRQIKDIIKTNDTDEVKYIKLRQFVESYIGKWGKEEYDPYSITLRAQNRIDDFKKYLTPNIKSIIDIGAGNGEILAGFANYLNIANNNLWAIDLSYYGTNTLEKRLNFQQVVPHQPIRLDSGKFSLIIMFQVMHHMKDLDLKLSEVYRLLAPGGLLFIREHDCMNTNTSNLIDIEHMLYDVTLANINYADAIANLDGTSYNDKQQWTSILERHGLTLIEIIEVTVKTNPTMYYNAVYKKIPV